MRQVPAAAFFKLVPEEGFVCVQDPIAFGLVSEKEPFYVQQESCYWLYSVPCDVAVHSHAYFVIPNGVIDGNNKEFSIEKGRFIVLLNGLQVPYMRTSTGFVLDDAPRPGDYLWCEVIS